MDRRTSSEPEEAEGIISSEHLLLNFGSKVYTCNGVII